MGRVIRAERRGPSYLPAGVYDAKLAAAAILERAREQADELRAGAVLQGLEQGRAEAARALLDVVAIKTRALEEAEESVVQAVALITKRLVGDAFAAEPQRILALVAPLLARVRRARSVVVRVHSSDASALRAGLDDCIARLDIEGAVELQTDDTLQRGGCVIESSQGELDARVETRVEDFTRALRKDPR
jgi:flagellar biosynthesis/type III secretory pathway protein FliH